MKGGWGVGHAEEHDGRFIESSVGDEGDFPLISFLYSDIVIPPPYVKLGEDLGVFEFVDEIGNQGKGICISDSVAVKVPVVLTRSEAAILFLDEEERGGVTRSVQKDSRGLLSLDGRYSRRDQRPSSTVD